MLGIGRGDYPGFGFEESGGLLLCGRLLPTHKTGWAGGKKKAGQGPSFGSFLGGCTCTTLNTRWDWVGRTSRGEGGLTQEDLFRSWGHGAFAKKGGPRASARGPMRRKCAADFGLFLLVTGRGTFC